MVKVTEISLGWIQYEMQVEACYIRESGFDIIWIAHNALAISQIVSQFFKELDCIIPSFANKTTKLLEN